MWSHLPHTRIYHEVTEKIFTREILVANRPAVLKGFVKDWPLLKLAEESPEALCNYFKHSSQNNSLEAWLGSREMKGRFFYSDDIKGRNFDKRQIVAKDFFDQLIAESNKEDGSYMFAGAVDLHKHMPSILDQIKAPFLNDDYKLTSLWIGTRSRTAAHWDLPQNLACVVAGKRRFITFPIEQLKNLYFGPIDNTLAGQAISLVDFYKPDYERFPLFKEAMEHAEIAELEPGDALYMPSMRIHHVESLENFGAMINFWWRTQEVFMPTPLLTLCHALLTLRELPEYERKAWREVFDHYIFSASPEITSHIPADALGILGKLSTENQQKLNNIILQSLKN